MKGHREDKQVFGVTELVGAGLRLELRGCLTPNSYSFTMPLSFFGLIIL